MPRAARVPLTFEIAGASALLALGWTVPARRSCGRLPTVPGRLERASRKSRDRPQGREAPEGTFNSKVLGSSSRRPIPESPSVLPRVHIDHDATLDLSLQNFCSEPRKIREGRCMDGRLEVVHWKIPDKSIPSSATNPVRLHHAVNAEQTDVAEEKWDHGGWQIRSASQADRGHRPAVGPVSVVQFDALPPPAVGDVLYTVASIRHGFLPRFWIRLTSRSPSANGFLQTQRLPPGRYRLVVRAADARGNWSQRTFALRVRGPG